MNRNQFRYRVVVRRKWWVAVMWYLWLIPRRASMRFNYHKKPSEVHPVEIGRAFRLTKSVSVAIIPLIINCWYLRCIIGEG